MRWILCGKNDAAVGCLEYLVERGDEVWAIANRGDDGRDGWQKSLRAAAQRLGVRVDAPPRINAPEFVDRLADYGARALVSVQYDQILKADLFEAIGCPCLNLHFALLPRHRGVAPIAWALLCGDDQSGVTLHHMVVDIDAGDLIDQRRVAILPQDTARDVYDKVSEATVELFRAAYPFSDKDLATRWPQDEGEASYHRAGELDFSARRVCWDRPARELHRWLRAFIFPPLQYPEAVLEGRVLCITRVAGELGDAVDLPPGTVVACSPESISVATADRSIQIAGMIDAGSREPGSGLVSGARPGSRFESS